MTPSIHVIADDPFLGNYFVNFLKKKGLEVSVSRNLNSLTKDTKHLVIINLGKPLFKNKNDVKKIIQYSPKVVVVSSIENKDLIFPYSPIKQIFIDQLIPSHCNLFSDLIALYNKDGEIFVPKEAWLNVVAASELSEKITEELFSFSNEKRILFGKLVAFSQIANIVRPESEISIDRNRKPRLPDKGLRIEETNTNIKEEIEGLGRSQNISVKAAMLKKPKIKIKLPRLNWKVNYNWFFKFSSLLVLGIMVLLVSPYILFTVAAGSSFATVGLLEQGNTPLAKKTLSLAKISSDGSILMFGTHGGEIGKIAQLISRGTTVLSRIFTISEYVENLSPDSLGDSKETEKLVVGLNLELEALYRDLSFLETEISKREIPFINLSSKLDKLPKYRRYVLAASELSYYLPTIMGLDRPHTYMLLLQNNMELRPTGGFIGSFALVTFSKGKLIDKTIYDVYSADGQLKGYIKPPDPIKEHLGEASWTLRDSNWDPDFPTSAKRAEWFLDKSLNREVDGVVAINLEVAKSLLNVLGPVKLPNFEETVTKDNLYEKVQYQVESDFFPGSRKKAQYLNDLSEAIINRLSTANSKELAGVLSVFVDKLNSRDLEIYLNDDKSQEILAREKWDGGVKAGTCTEINCQDFFAGLVEANVGVNKANYFIKREVKTNLTIKDQYAYINLEEKITNTATGKNKIPEERYKVYIRALAGKEGALIGVTSQKGGIVSPMDVDIEKLENRLEYGTLLEVLPGESKSVVFTWRVPLSLNFSENGKLNFNWWKQSGVGEYPFEVSYNLPHIIKEIKTDPPLRLTKEGGFLYNTNLIEDVNSTIEWKSK